MQTPFVVPPLDGIVPVNFQLKPVLQTATQPQCNQIAVKSQPLREKLQYETSKGVSAARASLTRRVSLCAAN